MMHATEAALDRLEPLLQKVRRFNSLREKSRGVFYHKSKAFLHFHEDPAGLFGDLRLGDDWKRFPVNTHAERLLLLKYLSQTLGC